MTNMTDYIAASFGVRDGRVRFVRSKGKDSPEFGRWFWKFYCDDYNVFATEFFVFKRNAVQHFKESGGQFIE